MKNSSNKADEISISKKNFKLPKSVQLAIISTAIATHVTACTNSKSDNNFSFDSSTEANDTGNIQDARYNESDFEDNSQNTVGVVIDSANADSQDIADITIHDDNTELTNLEVNNPILETELIPPNIAIEEPPIPADLVAILDTSESEFQGFTSISHGTDIPFYLKNNTDGNILTRLSLRIELSDCDRNTTLLALTPEDIASELSLSVSGIDELINCDLISGWLLASNEVALFYTCFETEIEPGMSEYNLHLARNNIIQMYGLGGVDWDITTTWTLLEAENSFSTNFNNFYGTFNGGHITLVPSAMNAVNLGSNPFFSGLSPSGVPSFNFPETAVEIEGDLAQIQFLTSQITANTLEGRELSTIEVDQILDNYQISSEFYRPFVTGMDPFITEVSPEERLYNLMFAPNNYIDQYELPVDTNLITTNIGVLDSIHEAFDIEHPEFNKIILTQEISQFESNAESVVVRSHGIDIELPYVDIDTSLIRYTTPLRREEFGNNATRVFAPGELLNTSTHIFNTDDDTFCVTFGEGSFEIDLEPCPTEEEAEQ